MYWVRFRTIATLMTVLAALACDDDDNESQTNASTSSDAGTVRAGTGSRSSGGTSGGVVIIAGRNAGPTGGVVAGASAGTGGTLSTAGRAGAGTAGRAGAAAGGVGGTSANAGSTAGTGAALTLSDAQIASIALTANAGEIEQNMVAEAKTNRASIAAFARDLVAMHTAAQQRETALFATVGLVPADNPTSAQLRDASSAIVARLRAASAADFDAIYIMSQIDVHSMVLNLIEQTLLPQASSDSVRIELTTMRNEVRAHLATATQLRDTLDDLDAGAL